MLGLGLSGPQVSEGWYGVPFVSPLGRTREYIDIVRMALAREKVAYEGKHWHLPAKEGLGLGKPLKMIGRPVQDSVPIYLGVMGEKTVRQAGQIADGTGCVHGGAGKRFGGRSRAWYSPQPQGRDVGIGIGRHEGESGAGRVQAKQPGRGNEAFVGVKNLRKRGFTGI